jgi:hypothetical protein
MAADGDSSGGAGRPDPTNAGTAAEYVDAMRRLKLWTGWGYRRLEKNAAAAGQALPRSTLTVALSRTTLPREDLVAAFARACGCDDNETAEWLDARRRIAAAPDPAPQPAIADPPATRPPAEGRLRPRVWPVRAAVLILVLAVAATIAVILLRQGNPAAPGPGQAAPPTQPGESRRPQPGSPATGTTATSTSTTPDPGQPAAPATTTTGPIPRITIPMTSPPVSSIPTGSTSTRPRPTTTSTTTTPPPPTTETIQLPDGRTIHCPLPYRTTESGSLAQCTMTMQSGDQASIGWYSPLTHDFTTTWDNLHVAEPAWFDAQALSWDGIQARVRGFATMETMYGPAVWATQYRGGEARVGIFNILADRFDPHENWRPAG